MEVIREVRNHPSEIRNKVVYYSSIVVNLVTFGTSIVSVFFLNVYYDTITNERNNNWDPETRKDNPSRLNLCYNLGGFTGMILAFLVCKLNPRVVLNFSRVGVSICCLCLAIPNILVMSITRYLSNAFSFVAQITIIWTVYELYLVRDQSKIMVALSLSIPSFNLLVSLSSKFDPGDAWYWRIILCVLPSVLILTIFVDVFCSKGLNSVTYLLRKKGRQATVEQLQEVFSDGYAEILVEKFDQQLTAEEREKNRLAEEGVSQWAMDLTVYKFSFITLLVVSFLATLGFQLQYVSNGLLIGSKNLSDLSATQRTKTAMFFETILELVSYTIVMKFNLTKKRKRSLLIGQLIASLVLTTSCLGYLFGNLDIVRFGMVCLALSFPFYSPALHVYANDLVPPSLLPWESIFIVLINTAADTALPILFDFEENSYKSIGLKFGFLAIIAFVSLALIYFFMIETESLAREVARIIHEARWNGGRHNKDGFVDLDETAIGETPRD